MKKILTFMSLLLFLAISSSQLKAQETRSMDELTMTKQEARKAAREAHKKAQAATDLALHQQAVAALKDGSFAVEVDQVVFPRGSTQFVSSLTNFIYVNDGDAVVQLALSNFRSGQNGLGGITVEGNPSNITMKSGKNGMIYYNMVVQGIAISATVNIQLTADANRATVTVYPNFNNNNITLTGTLVPYEQSTIFQGTTL